MIIQFIIKSRYLIFVIIVAMLSVIDLVNFGIPPTHDGEYHVMRFHQFSKVLGEGILYPRWAPDFNNGFGVPLFNYVYPLPNYFSSFFHFFGVGFIDAFKLSMVVATGVGAISMYLWSKKFWGDIGGVVSSVFYTFSPYHFLDIYVRGSVGEVWSLALAPCLLWAYSSYVGTDQKKYLVFSSVLICLLILAHNILAVLFFGFFIFYAIILQRGNFKHLFIITISGLGLSSPFWLPAILETQYVVGLQVFDPTRHFPIFYKLIYSSWGYGFSGGNAPDQMSFQIGIANTIVLGLAFFLSFRIKQKANMFFCFAVIAFILFLLTPLSLFVWKWVTPMSYIQFPWRLLSILILIISFLAGFVVSREVIKNKQISVFIALVLIILSIGFGIRYAKAPFYHKRFDQHYLSRANFTDGTNSPGNAFNTKWLLNIPNKEKNKIISDSPIDIKINSIKSQEYKFSVISTQKTRIFINTSYFPGWTAIVNNKQTRMEEYEGRLSLEIKPGVSNIRVYLDSTPTQKFSYMVFLVSILALVVFRKKTPAIIKR